MTENTPEATTPATSIHESADERVTLPDTTEYDKAPEVSPPSAMPDTVEHPYDANAEEETPADQAMKDNAKGDAVSDTPATAEGVTAEGVDPTAPPTDDSTVPDGSAEEVYGWVTSGATPEAIEQRRQAALAKEGAKDPVAQDQALLQALQPAPPQ